MSGEEQDAVVRNVVQRIDEDDASPIEISDNPRIVNNLVINVNWPSSALYYFVEDVNSSIDACAESSWLS